MYEKIILPNINVENIKKQFFTVLSVELGNTTMKSVIISTNVKTNQSFQVNKLVKLTRNIRLPYDDEEVFGTTIWDKPLSKEAIEESIHDLILESLAMVNLGVDDLDFVVRSTGVTAISSLSNDLGVIIKALSDACLSCGIAPSKMTAPFSINNIPEHIRGYSFFNTIKFDGSVVSVNSPSHSGMISNEMEGELVTAGIKLASKSSLIEFRNPVISFDMGTTLAGQVVDNSKPYANLLCNYVGLAGGISDILLRGSKIIKENESTIDLTNTQKSPLENHNLYYENTIQIHEHIEIMEVPENVTEYGSVSIRSDIHNKSKTKIIGSKIKDKEKLIKTFNQKTKNMTQEQTLQQIDHVCAYIIKRLYDTTKNINIINDETTIGITGRAGITGNKPEIINKYFEDETKNIIFVQDALALGAVMMARCMNSLGTPTNPIGGSKNSTCIMQQRIQKISKNR